MRFLAARILPVILLATSLAGSAWGISLTEYKFPESTSQQAYVNGTFNSSGDNSGGAPADTTQTRFSLGGNASYDLFYRSLPFTYTINTLGSVSVDRASTAGADAENAYNLMFNSSANKYFSEVSDYFATGSTRLEYRKLAGAGADDPYWDVTVGVGRGRTIDATVLKQAIRMNEDFRKYKVVNRDLPDAALLELASVIDRESEYRSRYGPVEYRKYWYGDMERVVADSGVLEGDDLGAIGIIRIEEILNEPTGRRFYGSEISANVGVVISDFAGNSGDPLARLLYNWARPVGIDLQLTNNASVATVFQDDQTWNFNDVFRVYYELSNRVDWDNSVTLNYLVQTATGAENVTTMNLTSTYILYLENRLTFNPSFIANWVDDGLGDAAWDWAVNASVQYRLR